MGVGNSTVRWEASQARGIMSRQTKRRYEEKFVLNMHLR